MAKIEKQFIYNRESFISSLLADAITFGSLIGLMFINYQYWGGHWYSTIFIWIMLFTSAAAKGSKRIHTFYNIDDCIKYLEKQKAKENN